MQRRLQRVWFVSPAELLVLLGCAHGMAQRASGLAGSRTVMRHAPWEWFSGMQGLLHSSPYLGVNLPATCLQTD